MASAYVADAILFLYGVLRLGGVAAEGSRQTVPPTVILSIRSVG